MHEDIKLFPKNIPSGWMAGFLHYHTAFGFLPKYRVTPAELTQEVDSVGGDFAFCAGDHGIEVDGETLPQCIEGKEYYELTLGANADTNNRVVLIPTGEYNLWFPDSISRDRSTSFWETKRKYPSYQPFHHTLIPMIDWTDAVCRFVCANTSSAFIEAAEASSITPTLNHPGMCHLTGHPDPLSIPWLKQLPYIEMFNTMDYFDYDWAIYKYYLSRPESCQMGVYAGTDFCTYKGYGVSTVGNERAECVTYIHSPNGRSPKNLYDAWGQRRTVAVRGRLFLEHISHVPCLAAYKITGPPEINFVVRSFSKKQIRKIEILRNGVSVYCEYTPGQEIVERHWIDKDFEGPEARYTLVVEAEGDRLITSPIGFRSDL